MQIYCHMDIGTAKPTPEVHSQTSHDRYRRTLGIL
jgi:tRNA A37 N6-isopentenylltransferase MiaA